jgi:nitrite reductase/ring-hydroxylating ferredoxin subunit
MIREMDHGRTPHARLTRRTVVRGAFWLLAATAFGVFVSMTTRFERALRRPRQLTIPPGSYDAITFVDDVVVCREDQKVRVFAARCTHLGCRISQVADGLIACPCHGSKFRPDGSVASGPATRPLVELAHTTDPRSGVLIVHVS